MTGKTPSIPGAPSKIRWDDSKARSVNAEVVRAVVNREEIALLFGRQPSEPSSPEESVVELTNRILLNPFAAKRLALLLDRRIREYESRFGRAQADPAIPSVPAQVPFAGKKPIPSKEEIAVRKAGLLLQLIKDLHVEYGFERSFKVFKGTLLANRFLVTLSRKSMEPEPQERILDLCKQIGIPEGLTEVFTGNLPRADYFHFGFEENERSSTYKAYLEFGRGSKNELQNRPDRSMPFLLHLGFKWDTVDSTKHALTRYTCFPRIPLEEILGKLSGIYEGPECKVPLEITRGIVEMASTRIAQDKIFYLEVTEENNPRRSFDMNLYKAKLRLKDLDPLLSAIVRHYSIASEEFRLLYDRFKTKRFGHLSGGMDREGRDFLTVYYGVEGH